MNAREILNQFNIHSNHLKEVEEGLQVLKQRIADGIESICCFSKSRVGLEDINTKRLSLRIQLSQLIKEKSLLLFSTVSRQGYRCLFLKNKRKTRVL